MELRDLGLDQWFADRALEQCDPDLSIARVTAVERGGYLVHGEQGEIPAELTGRLQFVAGGSTDLPTVGDWVCVRDRDGGTQASIHGLLPRRSFLRRKVPGKDIDFQLIAANIDVAFVIQACHFDFNVRRLERYLVMVREGGIEPVVLLTKTDLVSAAELQDLVGRIRDAGIDARIITLSNVTGAGLDEVRGLLVPGRTYCLLGSSGVGKSTLINRLADGVAPADGAAPPDAVVLPTQAVSHTGEGRHTTTRRQLIALDGGALLIDMPGMRELGMIGVSKGLDDTFADIAELATKCRFTDCRHASEPGCAVRAAVERHDLDAGRLRNYLKLSKEAAFHDLSYLERRQKAREFGRMARSVPKRNTSRGR